VLVGPTDSLKAPPPPQTTTNNNNNNNNNNLYFVMIVQNNTLQQLQRTLHIILGGITVIEGTGRANIQSI